MRAAIVVALLSSAAAWAQSVERGMLVSLSSERCLGGREQPVTMACAAGRELALEPQGDGTFLIADAGACLFSNRDGRFGWFACTPGYRDQHWAWLPSARGRQLRAAHSGQCLTAGADGGVSARRCDGERVEQRWRIARAAPVTSAETAGASMVGDWDWMDGARTAVRPDGTFVMPNDGTGSWRALGGGEVQVRWGSGRVDRLRLSADGATLAGVGVIGGERQRVTARRSTPPNRTPVGGDADACTTAADCVIFCPSAPSCCGSPCGCTHAMRRDHTAQLAADFARTCSKPPHCPAMDCQRKEAGFADCRNGRCVPAMIH